MSMCGVWWLAHEHMFCVHHLVLRRWFRVFVNSEFDSTKGFPGEGPGGRPPKQRQSSTRGAGGVRLSSDLREGVQSETARRYVSRVHEFDLWLASENLPCVDHLVSRDQFKVLNAALAAILQYGSDHEYPTSHGSFLLAGLQFVYPLVRGHLQSSWSALQHWQNLSPPTIRSPMPVEFLLACATALWIQGMKRTACALLVGFHALLRPLELASIQR
eukprot:6480714-Amphidinium_carterae.1